MIRQTLILTVATAALVCGEDHSDANSGVHRPVSSRELDQLRMDIADSTRSSVEAIGEYHTETGDVNNRLDYFRYGAQLNYRVRSNQFFYLRGTGTSYRTPGDVLNQRGVNLTAGIRSSLSESVTFRAEAGATRFSTDATTINGLGSIEFKPSGGSTFYLRGSRSNVEETLLSATGIRPAAGPFGGRLAGLVMDNRALAGGRINLPYNFDIFGEGGGGTRTGSNVESNPFRTADAGLGYRLYSGPENSSVNLARASYQFDYFGFDKDLLGFGGASLVDRRGNPLPMPAIGSDGIPPSFAPGQPGAGGYFSPQRFMSHVGRIELQGRPSPGVEYRISGFLGTQDYTGLREPRTAGGFNGTITFRLTDRLSLPIAYIYDNVGPFQQHTIVFRLAVKI